VTGSIGSSFRSYYDNERNRARPSITPRALTQRVCTDIRHWSEPGRGGHFLAFEEPDLMAAD
jgi:hypothetical protein